MNTTMDPQHKPSETPRLMTRPEDSQGSSSERELTGEILVEYTAYGMAFARAAESQRDDAIIHDPYAELLAGDVGASMLSLFSKWTPHANDLNDFIAVRTRSVDEALIHRHESIQQVVILGAGLDTRAYRMESLSDCLVVEIDASEALMQRKLTLLEEAGVQSMAKQHAVIVADLAQDAWELELAVKGFDPHKPTFWLLEGLLYYMTQDSNVRLMKTLDGMSAPNSELWADISGFALVQDRENADTGELPMHLLKYGENDPTKGVLSLLNWQMEVTPSQNNPPKELFGREFKSMKAYNSDTSMDEDVPWFFVTATKPTS